MNDKQSSTGQPAVPRKIDQKVFIGHRCSQCLCGEAQPPLTRREKVFDTLKMTTMVAATILMTLLAAIGGVVVTFGVMIMWA